MNAFGRRTKFTWRSLGVTYLARDPNAMGPVQFTWRPSGVTLYVTHYVHNSMNLWKNEIYFLYEFQLPVWSCL